jgi:ligand-binding SRPBCC domain-containing protein
VRRHVFETSQWLSSPPEVTFGFFSDPSNLARITPPDLGFAILTPGAIEMRAGARIDYRIRLCRLPVRWTSLIEVWEPNARFVDVQVRGPYRLWRHEHTFEARDGGTLVGDRVEYALPLFPFGEFVHPLLVRPDLDRIFSFRSSAIRRILDGGKGGAADARPADGQPTGTEAA